MADITQEPLLEKSLMPKEEINSRPRDEDLRILIFTACYFVLDGVTLTIRRLESHLRSRGVTIKIVSTVPDDFCKIQSKDIIKVKAIKVPFQEAGNGLAFGASLDEDCIREMEKFNPNCVHFTVPDLISLEAIKWCQRNNIAYMATWHSNYVDYLKYYLLDWILGYAFNRYLKAFYEQIPTVYVPTPYIKTKMEKLGYGRHTQIKFFERGVDLKLFDPQRRSNSFRTSKGINPDDVVLLWVGRLVPEKRVDIWTNVIKRLQGEGIPVKAIVVGHGTFEASLSQIQNVSVCGWMSGVALAEAYASADVLLFPSDVETFGNVTLEALASGCPSIVEQKCGGHLVEHGFNGFTCEAGNAEQFYQATKRIVVDAHLRRTMSVNARRSAHNFEFATILQKMAENYKDAIVNHRDPQYIKRHLDLSPEARGVNCLTYLCCNYWFVRTFAEPFLNTTSGLQNITICASSCAARLFTSSCCSAPVSNARFEDERKGRSIFNISPSTLLNINRVTDYCAVICSYVIVLLFVYASFTV